MITVGKLSNSINSIELKTNKATTTSLPSDAWTDKQYPTALSIKNLEDNFMEQIYPVGSLYKTTSASFNPSTAGFKGTWTLIESGVEQRHISSQIIHPGLSGTGQVSRTKLVGCYDQMLFRNLYNDPEFQQPGYHIEIRVSAMISTADKNNVTLYLNNVALGTDNTWSGTTYRVPILSTSYIPTNIALETIPGYDYQGVSLCYSVSHSDGSNAYRWDFWDVCLHCYLVSNDTIYTWKRTA